MIKPSFAQITPYLYSISAPRRTPQQKKKNYQHLHGRPPTILPLLPLPSSAPGSTSLLRYTCHAAARGGGGGRRDCVQEIADLALIRIESEAERESEMEAHSAERLLHVQMAEAVAQFRGYGTSKIKSVSASSVNRGVKSPSDVSMISLD
ncbi:uncharacterized protein DS421_11g341190 [Arachis hypogaea]|nr:uncharacterized protein DS421_11g341190 [Arachis hypogaea]